MEVARTGSGGAAPVGGAAAMYPEDCEIDVQQLLRRWRAEGFIKAIEENFVTVFSDPNSLVSQGKVRRLLLDYRGQENVMPMCSMVTCNVRSVSIFGYREQMLPISDLNVFRVLHIESGNKMMEICGIGKLLQLRYLRIDLVTHLTEEIGELLFLEILDLPRGIGTEELPKGIVKLRRLKFLHVHDARLPDGVGNMQALEELAVSTKEDNLSSINSLEQLGTLTKLRILHLSLSITDENNHKSKHLDTLTSSLNKLLSYNLRYLYFDSYWQLGSAYINLDFSSSPSYLLQELHIRPLLLHGIPERPASLANLTYLDIRIQQVTQETLEILGDLPALLSLLLVSAFDNTKRFSIYRNKFRCLESLNLDCSASDMMFHAGAMPTLVDINFTIKAHSTKYACANRNLGIHHLSTLKALNVYIDCQGATAKEVEAVVAAIKNEASLLPNCYIQHIRISREEGLEDIDISREEGWEEGGHSIEQQEEITNPHTEHTITPAT
uniref:Disease resistance protein RPM1, putative, expressed n=1 Tax=Oryza sativa subsp. japonica TaxID=39947 RepID=Q2R0W2_ORYSJ|nr:disease resistance protein RPM1, putative, expressed [Oryza sativa Japonica Group]